MATTRPRGELSDLEENLLGIERPTPEDEERTERDTKEKAEIRKQLFQRLMQEPVFRDWLWEKLMEFGAFQNRILATPTGFPDDKATWFNLGLREAGWSLYTEFDNIAPGLVSAMRREHEIQKV